VTAEIDRVIAPFEPMWAHLDTIPGVDRKAAVTLVAESGGDMSRFPTAGHLCSWAGLCPGQDESAGKRRSGRTRRANRYLRSALIEGGLAATRAKATALQARSYRVKRNRGHKKAVVATGHHILEIAFDIMRDGGSYQELGADYFDRHHRDRAIRRHVRQLEALGYTVTLNDTAA
jgi:transposase